MESVTLCFPVISAKDIKPRSVLSFNQEITQTFSFHSRDIQTQRLSFQPLLLLNPLLPMQVNFAQKLWKITNRPLHIPSTNRSSNTPPPLRTQLQILRPEVEDLPPAQF